MRAKMPTLWHMDEMRGAAKWTGKKLVGIYRLESLVNVSLEVKAEQAK